MTKYPIYQIDAFTDKLFLGNPAAIVPVETFPKRQIMQAVAFENNLSETAFVALRKDGGYNLRWFTPLAEVDFCGHATIAAAHVLISERSNPAPIIFHTKIGILRVEYGPMGYTMCSPRFTMTEIPLSPIIKNTFDDLPTAAWHSRKNIFLMFPSADKVAQFAPDFSAIKALSSQKGVDDGVVIMAPGDKVDATGNLSKYDFISRYFVPAFGINEDPVTGSNHASLGPFWAKRIGKTQLTAYQASARGGVINIVVKPDQVHITGQAITFLRGEIDLPDQ